MTAPATYHEQLLSQMGWVRVLAGQLVGDDTLAAGGDLEQVGAPPRATTGAKAAAQPAEEELP